MSIPKHEGQPGKASEKIEENTEKQLDKKNAKVDEMKAQLDTTTTGQALTAAALTTTASSIAADTDDIDDDEDDDDDDGDDSDGNKGTQKVGKKEK